MKAGNIEFHQAVIQIERQLWKAGSAIALVKVLWDYVQTLTYEQKASDFLASVKDAAWTAAVVKTYTLLTDRQSVTIPFLIEKLGAKIDNRSKAPYLSAKARAELMVDADKLVLKVKHIKDLRNTEEAHTSGKYDIKKVFEGKSVAEPEVREVYSGCLVLMDKFYSALGHGKRPRMNFEAAIRDDMLKRLIIP